MPNVQPIIPSPPSSTVTPCSPSPALLALLASITPPRAPAPDFLCPSLSSTTAITIKRRRSQQQHQQQQQQQLRNRADHDRIPFASSSSTTSLPVPVKYEQSKDGKWYPAKSWSLHGKSKLPSPTTSASVTHPDFIDSVANTSAITTLSLSSSTSQSTNDITDSLPTGWRPGPSRTKFYDTPVIVVVSLILAIVVTLVIAGCVVSHKNRSAVRDLERAKRVRAKGGVGDSEDDDDEDEDDNDPNVRNLPRRHHRRQQQLSPQSSLSTTLVPTPSSPSTSRIATVKKDKMWERWRRQAKAGLRRRRRWRRPVEDNAEPLQRESSAHIPISPPPPPPSLQPSQHSTQRPPSSSLPPPLRPVLPVAAPFTPTLPPAYRPISRARQEENSGNGPGCPEEWRRIYMERTRDEESGADEVRSSSVPLRAHVATDDKAVLEHMRRQASEPWQGEAVGGEAEEGHVAARAAVGDVVQVPIWEDERLEDFGEMDVGADAHYEDRAGPSSTRAYACGQGAAHASSMDAHLHLPLPPRPIRAMHAHVEEDEDDLGLLPYYAPRFEAGPSAPPMLVVDAGPSAPPLPVEDQADEMVASQPNDEREGCGVGVGNPSAPPGEDEDPNVHPSAPPLDESPERDWSRLGHVPRTSPLPLQLPPPPPPPISSSSSSSYSVPSLTRRTSSRTDSELPTRVSGPSSRSSVSVDSRVGLPRYEP